MRNSDSSRQRRWDECCVSGDGTPATGRAQSTSAPGRRSMFRKPPPLSYDDLITGEKFVGICDAVWFHYEPKAFAPDPTSSRLFYSDTYRAEELFARLPRSAREM